MMTKVIVYFILFLFNIFFLFSPPPPHLKYLSTYLNSLFVFNSFMFGGVWLGVWVVVVVVLLFLFNSKFYTLGVFFQFL